MSQTPTAARCLAFLLPAACLGCGRACASTQLGLCPACHRHLREAARPACRVCARSLVGGDRCAACRDRLAPYERLLAGWLYLPPCDRVVLALKFRGLDYLGEAMARQLAGRFRSDLAGCDLVVPVPLHWTRRLRRGYNQAERLATPLARALDLPRAAGLRRQRRTRPQTRLGRDQRLGAVAGAFGWRGDGRLVRGARVVLVDDVATTGATLAAAAEALLEAGAAAVIALVAARVPGPGEVV